MSDQRLPRSGDRIRRIPELAHYDRATIDAVLDAGMVAHVGIVDAGGEPVVIPMAYARSGDEVVVHGSVASRLMRHGAAGAAGAPDGQRVVCLTVTLLDGLIVARSLFESSMRYRSVVVRGVPRSIEDPEEKSAALLALSDRLIPGRVSEARLPTEKELAATRVFALSLDGATAKVGDGFSDDPPDDVSLPIWAGVVPLETTWGPPEPSPDLADGIAVPPSVSALAHDPRLERPERSG